MAKRNIQSQVNAAVRRAVAVRPLRVQGEAGVGESRLIQEPLDFACVNGEGLLQVKPGMESRARLLLASELLGAANQTLSHSNDGAEDLPWPTAELVQHAVATADALLRYELAK